MVCLCRAGIAIKVRGVERHAIGGSPYLSGLPGSGFQAGTVNRRLVLGLTSVASWLPRAAISHRYQVRIQNWRGRDGNDPSFDIAKDAERRF